MKRLGASLMISLMPLGLSAGLAAGCVDGTTPDCSDPATQCGPILDGAPARTEAALPDADSLADSAVEAAPADPDADAADLDAGDES